MKPHTVREPRTFELAASALASILLAFAGYALWRTNGSEPEWMRLQRTWATLTGDGAPLRLREIAVTWRCTQSDAGACNAAADVERCTTCHIQPRDARDARATVDAPRVLREHPHAQTLLGRHADVGCVACHGGDPIAIGRSPAHAGLATLQDVPEVQARCALCHEDTRPKYASPARDAWARWRALREGRPPPPPSSVTQVEADLASTLTKGRALFQSLRCGACHAAGTATETPIATPLDVLGLRSSTAQLQAGITNHTARTAFALQVDDIGALAVATRLRAMESQDAATALLHRANVPGSSAEDGRLLEAALGCAQCHDALHVDASALASARTPDWLAYYLSDPVRANAAATMPSLRLSPREAASLAQRLVPTRTSPDAPDVRHEVVACHVNGATTSMPRDACGESIITASKCGACHANKLAPSGSSFVHYGDATSWAEAMAKLTSHVGFDLDDETRRALATFLVSHVTSRARPDLHVSATPGDALVASLGCGSCHALDDLSHASGPSLFGEGLRVRPQWLFELLRAPERHAVRPPLHPEWAYRDLVPADRVALRMPTYTLTESNMTALVRFFAERDGASFPYAATTPIALGREALVSAIGDVTRKDRGACMSCHTIAPPDVARTRVEVDSLAPPLALARDRLRPEWIEACIAQPEVWVSRMPAFLRPPAEIEHVRDLVLLLRDRTVLPAPGAEGLVPALGLGDIP